MSFLRGEDVNIGFGIQSDRAVPVAPAVWIPGRAPTGIKTILEKVAVKETIASKFASQGSEITQKRAEGPLEFNLRVSSLGYILKSLLGSVTSGVKSGESAVYEHTFSILASNPEHPALTLALSQPGIQDYEYALALARSLEIRTPVDDLINATADFIAKSEAEHSAYSPVFAANDYYFRHQDIVIKLATTLAGLDAAAAIKLKDFSIAINNNARVNQNISEINPSNVIAGNIEVSGSFSLDYLDKTLHDAYAAGSYRALRIEMTRSDITIGAASNPKFVIDLPKISLDSYDPDRPLDDIVMDKLKFNAHYSLGDALAIRPKLTNEKANYNS